MQGHIHKRVHTCKDGHETTRWYVVVDIDRAADGRRRQKWHGGFRTRREAEAARAELVSAIHGHRYVAPSKIRFREWILDRWLPVAETRVRPTTLRGYRQTLEQHVLPTLGERPIQQITSQSLEELYAGLVRDGAGGRGLGLKTVSNVHRTLSKALTDAVDAGVLVRNVATSAKAPRPARTPRGTASAWRPEELAAFLRAASEDRLAAVWRLAAMTGMRRGELLGLRWQDVDLPRKCIGVHRTLVDVNYRVLESTPKGNSRRVIDVDDHTALLLAHHRERQLAERHEWAEGYEDHDLVASWQNGSLIHPHALSRMFGALVRKERLHPIRLHDLRHTHATLALQAGVPLPVVSERLGHHSPAFTARQYAHALPGSQAVAAAAVADLVDSVGPDGSAACR